MYEVREIAWVNHYHPQLQLWGIYKKSKRTRVFDNWTWYILITDDREHAEKFLRDMLYQA